LAIYNLTIYKHLKTTLSGLA